MYARVTRLQVPKYALDEDIELSDESARVLETTAGSCGFYYFADRETGKTMAITLWDTEEDLLASEDLGASWRERRTAPLSATEMSVERYEVVWHP